MGRPVDMTVNNFTGKTLILIGVDVEHGKFTEAPPKEIKFSQAWACATRSDTMMGPKGSATYAAKDRSFEVEFSWDHPYGSSSSSYQVSPRSNESVLYDIKGVFTGHKQSIQFQLMPV